MDEMVFCKSGGCTAKLGAHVLERVLAWLEKRPCADLLVGFDAADDAAVYRLTDEIAVVQTLDFFPPMVEDPYLFGQIAATNALSDVYAMGGQVKSALNIVCFPEKMDLNILGRILQGGNAKVLEAGGVLAGGHSIADESVKYGLSVMGTVHPAKIWKNNGCRAGDVLLLTKPLGVGIQCAARRVGAVSEAEMEPVYRSMTTLNKYAAEVLGKFPVHACTDVTGFGLACHLLEMLSGRLSAEIDGAALPCFDRTAEFVEEFYLTAAAQRNRRHAGERVAFARAAFALEELVFDPQTSGGLLAALPAEAGEAALEEIRSLGLPCALVGKVTDKRERDILFL